MSTVGGQLFDPEIHGTRVCKVPNKCALTKARASLPDVLALKDVNGRIGISSKCTLAQATQFGPLEAPLVTRGEVEETNFLIKLDRRKFRRPDNSSGLYAYYDTTDENMCNWMMFVQPAKFYLEQNLCAHQMDNFIYFTTTREILAKEELKVWYSPTYAKFMSASLLIPTSGLISVPEVHTGQRKAGNMKASQRTQMVQQNTTLVERDVRSVPPKKRGWRRGRDKREDEIAGNITSSHLSQLNATSSVLKVIKTHQCQICRKQFKDNTKLKTHSVVHSNKRDFLCHCCGATFKRQDKLNDHITKVHGPAKASKRGNPKTQLSIKDYPFKCVECGIGFFRRGMFVVHLTKRHPDVHKDNVEDLARPIYKTVWNFQCPYCDKVYKSSTKRKLHIEKQHPGKELPATLKRRKHASALKSNAAGIVAKETVKTDPVCCQYCDRQYSVKHKRNKHVREKHPEMVKNSSVQASASNLPPAYDVDPTTFPDIAHQGVSGSLAANSLAVDSHPVPSLYPIVQMPNPVNSAQAEVYCPPSANQQSISGELTATDRDLLNQAMSELEPSVSTQQQQPYTDFQTSPPKRGSYSRYPLGRKRMLLKSYEDSQNQLLSQNLIEAPTPQTGKPMSYKSRLLSTESSWRSVNWQDDVSQCETNSITEMRQPSQPNSHAYSTLQPQHSLVAMLGPATSDETLLLSDSRTGHDVSVLNGSDMNDFVTDYPGSSNWIYHQGYDTMNVNTSYVSR